MRKLVLALTLALVAGCANSPTAPDGPPQSTETWGGGQRDTPNGDRPSDYGMNLLSGTSDFGLAWPTRK